MGFGVRAGNVFFMLGRRVIFVMGGIVMGVISFRAWVVRMTRG